MGMLTRAGVVIGDLFPDLASEPSASPQVLRRCDAVDEIRRKRAEGKHRSRGSGEDRHKCAGVDRRLERLFHSNSAHCSASTAYWIATNPKFGRCVIGNREVSGAAFVFSRHCLITKSSSCSRRA
jgi:hypothetical protein